MSKDILNKGAPTGEKQDETSMLPEVDKALAGLPEESRLKVEKHLAEYLKALSKVVKATKALKGDKVGR
jgi:hypothetical protein